MFKEQFEEQFSGIFKEDLTPEDRLDIELVKIQLLDHYDSITPYNAMLPVDSPRFLESVARKELQRILNRWALEEVHHDVTPWWSRGFFVQKPGSPDKDSSVRLVTNLQKLNEAIERIGYPMDGSSHILRRLDPQDTCFGVVDLFQGFHQIPLAKESRDLFS